MLKFISVNAHIVIVIVIVCGVDGPLLCVQGHSNKKKVDLGLLD